MFLFVLPSFSHPKYSVKTFNLSIGSIISNSNIMEKDNTFDPKETFPNNEIQTYPDDIFAGELPKSLWSRAWPVFACGAGLFSDGYLQSV